jgi:hypothetical protein
MRLSAAAGRRRHAREHAVADYTGGQGEGLFGAWVGRGDVSAPRLGRFHKLALSRKARRAVIVYGLVY